MILWEEWRHNWNIFIFSEEVELHNSQLSFEMLWDWRSLPLDHLQRISAEQIVLLKDPSPVLYLSSFLNTEKKDQELGITSIWVVLFSSINNMHCRTWKLEWRNVIESPKIQPKCILTGYRNCSPCCFSCKADPILIFFAHTKWEHPRLQVCVDYTVWLLYRNKMDCKVTQWQNS